TTRVPLHDPLPISGKWDGPAAPLPPNHPPPGIPPPAKVPYSSWREGPLLGGGFVFKEHAEGSGLACHLSGSICPAPGTKNLLRVAVLAPLEFRGLLPDLMPPSAHPMLTL